MLKLREQTSYYCVVYTSGSLNYRRRVADIRWLLSCVMRQFEITPRIHHVSLKTSAMCVVLAVNVYLWALKRMQMPRMCSSLCGRALWFGCLGARTLLHNRLYAVDVTAAVSCVCFRCYGRSQRRATVVWDVWAWARLFRQVCLGWRWRSCFGWLPVGRQRVRHFARTGGTARCARLVTAVTPASVS